MIGVADSQERNTQWAARSLRERLYQNRQIAKLVQRLYTISRYRVLAKRQVQHPAVLANYRLLRSVEKALLKPAQQVLKDEVLHAKHDDPINSRHAASPGGQVRIDDLRAVRVLSAVIGLVEVRIH